MDLGLYEGTSLTNEQYHGAKGFYSSSQYKVALKEIELFFKQYISGEAVGQKHIAAFDIGTYYHTAILEPETLDDQCAVYTEGIRSGKKWEAFKLLHEGKAIITGKELGAAENLITATKESPITMDLLSNGEAELSCFTEVMGLPTKVRADWINIQEGYILDLKSTTGNAKDVNLVKKKISDYQYDLSASLYIDAFNAHYGEVIIKDFYWTFASKDYANCRTYKATQEMLEIGRRKYKFAINQILKYRAQEWQFYDELVEIGPVSWEKEQWLKGQEAITKHKPVKPIRKTTDSDLL